MRNVKKEEIHIGIFDSGVGGLSVWRVILKIMPYARFSYLSDAAYCPYGPRSAEEIIERGRVITKFLLKLGTDIIVVACNTATAAAIDTLRAEFDIPFIGMEPAVKPAVIESKSGVVGVLATKGTFGGRLYNSTLRKYASDVKVMEQIGDGLVELVESGKCEGSEVNSLLRRYIIPMLNEGADHIVLGCTHYPFLAEEIRKIVGEKALIVDPAPAVAKHLLDIVSERFSGYEKEFGTDLASRTDFYSTGELSVLKILANSIVPGIQENKYSLVKV